MSDYLMQARDSVAGTMHLWTASSPDWAGAGFTGPNSAVVSTIAVVGVVAEGSGALTFLPYRYERALYSGKRKSDLNSSIGGNASSFIVSPDKSKIIMFSDFAGFGNRISQWSMSTPGDLETLSYDGFFSATAQDSVCRSISMNAAGTRLLVVGDTGNVILQYNLGTAWEIVSDPPTYAGSVSVAGQTVAPIAALMTPDGTKLHVTSNSTCYQYTLTTPGELIGGITYDSVSVGMAAAWQLRWGPGRDGTPGGKLFWANIGGVTSQNCPTPYTIAGSSLDAQPGFNPYEQSAIYGFDFLDDGKRLWTSSTFSDLCEFYVAAVVLT